MKVANFCHVVFLLVLAGCANPRTFSGGGYSGGNSTFAPTPATGGTYGGSTLGPAEGDFSQRSSRPITPAPSSPARSSSPPVSTAPKQAPKGPTLGLPTAKSPPLGADIPDGGSAVRSTIGVPLVWNRRYQSTQRRPIETLVFGTGNRRIMVIGSMHGDEPQSVGLVEELALHLRSNPDELVDLKLLLVKSPNP
ncbi:MAG: hypothetical protein NT069_08955, partial [Planctomycetota bacterium]|nr:hypothetical protein [Planctomycetota bacterium]